jgi:hypothetical protein
LFYCRKNIIRGLSARGGYSILPHRTKPLSLDLAETVCIRTSPGKAAFIALLATPLTGLCALLAAEPFLLSIHAGVGILGLVLFAPATAFALSQALRGRRPALDIGPEGVKVWRMGGLLVPWNKVAAIRAEPVSGQMLLCLDIPDWQQIAPAIPWWRRPVTRLNAMLGYPPLALSANGLAISGPDLTAIVTAYATAAGVPVHPFSIASDS